ncbi:MAG: TetR/AcrR family transcriptional regulator [Bifidobacteriaceae bacterium]|jgi:AcrR family transcriptional regulator|nr:TetR/AcrR family transcriptional regulator [Bifidobacteriaceae bacterium]
MTRSLLLGAAAEEFAKHGLKGARVQAIVERAGVNERMVYHHFGSKDGLYRAVIDAERRALADSWQPTLERAVEMEPVEGLRTALAALFDLIVERPQLMAVRLHEGLSETGLSSPPDAGDLPAAFRTIFERGQRQGLFYRDRSFEVAYGTMMGALVGQAILLPSYFKVAMRQESRVTFRESVLDHLIYGLTTVRQLDAKDGTMNRTADPRPQEETPRD